jgi:hypothetical protein
MQRRACRDSDGAMKNLRSLGLAVSLSIVALSVAACDEGFSPEEAQARCEEETKAYGDSGCMTELVFQACVDAYVECGEATTIANTCPLTYSCPSEDEGEGGEGGSGDDTAR